MDKKAHASVTTADGRVYIISFPADGGNVRFPSMLNGSSVTKVQISDGAEKINEMAFKDCTGLTSVTIPYSVTEIDKFAFAGCTNLKQVIIPTSVVEIGVEAFSGCTGLTNISIPNSVTNIGYSAFMGCTNLTQVSLQNGLTRISEKMFQGCCRLAQINIPNSVTSIGNLAFSGCTDLICVTIPDSVREIGVGAFYGCSHLRLITISDSVAFIGEHAFDGCAVIPQIATDVSKQRNSPDQSIYLYLKAQLEINGGHLPRGFNIPWVEKDEVPWAPGAKDGVALYHMHPLEKDENREQKILEALKFMSGQNNLHNQSRIMGIFGELDRQVSMAQLSDEINRIIGKNASQLDLMTLANYADYLITYGKSLLSVKIGMIILAGFNFKFIEEVMLTFGAYDEFTYFAARTLSQEKWENGNRELFELAQKVYGWGRIHAVSYLRPESQEIKDWLLYEGAVNDIAPQYSADVCLQKAEVKVRLSSFLPEEEFVAIEKLIRYALEDGPCPGITDAEQILPKYLKAAEYHSIDRELVQMILDKSPVFCDDSQIVGAAIRLLKKEEQAQAEFCFPESKDEKETINSKKGHVFHDKKDSHNDGDFVLENGILKEYCGSCGIVEIPEGTIAVDEDAFRGCSCLKSVIIPNSMTSIGNRAFRACSSLMSITIPESVTNIGDEAFCACSSLTSVNIPKSVSGIGDNVFRGCKSLASIEIPDSVTWIGSRAFAGCIRLKKVHIPERVTEIGYEAFSGCFNLIEVTIPDSVTSIENRAFEGCSSLKILYRGTSEQWNAIDGHNQIRHLKLITA